jgi:hypothetical protein
MKGLIICGLNLLALLPLCAQSRRDITERHIKSAVLQTTDYRKKNEKTETVFTRYDKKGNVLEYKEWEGDSVLVKWERSTYDKRGHETQTERLDAKGAVTKKITRRFDRYGNELERLEYDGAGVLTEKELSTFNQFREETLQTTYDGAGHVIRTTEFEYDSKGMLLSKKVFNSEHKPLTTRVFKYEY